MRKLVNGTWVDWIDKVKVLQKAVVVNSDGNLLALRRADDSNSRPGKWDLPGGTVEPEQVTKWKTGSGKGDANDILVKSILQEIFEETNLAPTKASAIHSASGFDDKKGVFIIAIGYVCEDFDTGKLKLSDEHSEHRWAAPSDFTQLDVGNDGGLIKSILERYAEIGECNASR